MEEEIITEPEIPTTKKGWKYGTWKQGMRTDSGKPLKKNGLKKGTILLKQTEIDMEIGSIVNYMTFGKSKIEHPDNIGNVLPNTPMTIGQACAEYGILPVTFYSHLRKFPALNEKYQELKESRREYLREASEANIQQALTGGMKTLSEKDKLDASFKMLEKTDRAYNPKMEIESKSISINLSKSSDDLYNDLASILGFNNKE